MIRSSRRSPIEQDFKSLTNSRGSFLSNIFAVSLPLTLLLFAIVYVLSRSLLLSGLLAALLFIGSFISNLRFFKEVKRRKELASNNQAVETFDVEASRILDIEPLGSNGPALCFFAGDGKALLLVGQWLLDQDNFPSATFKLHRWSDSKKPIRIDSTGPEVEPELSTVRLEANYKFNDLEFFDATPETLQQDLERALAL